MERFELLTADAMAAAQQEGARLVHESQALLDRTIEQLNVSEKWSIQWPCQRLSCKREQRPGVTDNARVQCFLDVRDETGAKPPDFKRQLVTGRDILRHNLEAERENRLDEVWHLSVICRKCRRQARCISATDTKERLHLDLREVVTHDKTLPLLFNPDVCQPDVPAEAGLRWECPRPSWRPRCPAARQPLCA